MNTPAIRLFATALMCVLAPCALAAEWSIEPSIETRANLTDNINLAPGVHDNIFGWVVAPQVIFARRSEVSEVAGTARLGINRYPGDSELNTDDVYLLQKSDFHAERSTYGLSAAYIRDSTLQSELAATGVVQARRQRNLISIAPSWNYSVTERSSIFAQYQYDWTSYEAGAGLEDYTNQTATGGYEYQLSERTLATVSGNFSSYRTDSGSTKTDSHGINVELMYSASDRLKLGLGVGTLRSDTTTTARNCPFDQVTCDFLGIPQFVTTESADDGALYKVSADYKWLRTHANIVASRDVNPTGGGLLVKTDRIEMGIGHDFNERLSASGSAAYLFSRYLGGLGSDTEYFNLTSNLSWKLDEWWTAAAGYSFAYQKVRGAPDYASANTVYLSISYNWSKISISR